MVITAHVTAVCRSGYNQLRQLRPVVRSLSVNATKTLVQAFISCRLAICCNSLLFGINDGLLRRLQYLADDCRLLSDVGRHPLRSNSNDMRKLLVPQTHNKLGDRSFSAAGPRLWNDLPPGLRRPGLTFDSFRQSLKTHLFGDRSA